jgi:hypothetical protein
MDIKSFWDTLCNGFGYRFFTGVPNMSLAPLFNTLDSKILHFVPAISDPIAVDIAAGIALCGDKAVVLCGTYTFDMSAIQIVNLIIKHELPVLFITTVANDLLNIRKFKLADGVAGIEQADDCISNQQPAILLYDDFGMS